VEASKSATSTVSGHEYSDTLAGERSKKWVLIDRTMKLNNFKLSVNHLIGIENSSKEIDRNYSGFWL